MCRRFAFLVLLWLAVADIVHCPETGTRNRNVSGCSLSDSAIKHIFDFAEGIWTVTDAFLATNKLQDVLDCAKNGETVALKTAKTIVLEKTLAIRKPITIRASQALEATTKPTLTCPSNDPLLLIDNASVVLENVVVRDCSFHDGLAFNSILRLQCEEKGEEAFVFSLFNVEFFNNYNVGGSIGINIENPESVSVTMRNVGFWNDDRSYGLELTHENNVSKILALWHAPDTLLELDPIGDLMDGDGTIVSASSLLESGDYSIVLRFSEVINRNVTMSVKSSNCLTNEVLRKDEKLCIMCEGEQCNNNVEDERNKICPKNAYCFGKYVLPLSGYWNPFPCSTRVRECPNRDACQGVEQFEVKKFSQRVNSSTCTLSKDGIKKYRDVQCDDGYQGLLCGSCEKDHGRIELSECVPCQNRVLIVIAMLISTCLLIYNVWEQIAANLELIKTQWMRRLLRPSVEEREENIRLALQMREHSAEYIDKAEKAKKKFVLMMQITLNFMQGMGTCLSLYRGWSSFLPRMLMASNWISLNVSQVYSFSFECLLPSNGEMPRSVLSAMLALIVPFALIGLFCIYWLYDTFKLKKSWKHLVKRCILSFVSILYISTFSVVKTAQSTFPCIKVYDAISLDDQDLSHSYWVGDTFVRCREGNYAILRYWIGISLIIFIGVYLLVIQCVLFAASKRDALHSEWIQETVGILFIGFRPGIEWWDVTIQLRKVLVAQADVLSNSFASLQVGLDMTLVYAWCSFWHFTYRPYGTDLGNLNLLEGLSLFVCMLTALIGTILAKQQVSSVIIKNALVTLVFFINAVSIIVYGYHLVTNKLIEIKYTLLLKGVVNEDDNIGVVLLKSWQQKLKVIRKLLGRAATIRRSSFDRSSDEIEVDSSTSFLPSSSNV